MPIIARFNGMVIKMYFQQSEHNPPHFHVIFGEYSGFIDIRTFEMIEGDLPNRELSLVLKWARKHQNELMEIWITQEFKKIPPMGQGKEGSVR